MSPAHCPMISKYDPSLSKALGSVDQSFLVVQNLTFIKKYSSYSESTNSTKQKVGSQYGSQYSETCFMQPLNKDITKILIRNGGLIKVKRIAECSPWSILQYF